METKTHEALAAELRQRLETPSGLTPPELRRAAAARVAGGPAMPEPYDTLVRQIGVDSAKVTDGQVGAVREATGSDKAAFEIVMAAAASAGLERWKAALRVLREAADAPE